MNPTKLSPAFDKFVQEWIDKNNSFLVKHGWLDPNTGGPIVAAIAPSLAAGSWPYPDGVEEALTRCFLSAPAHEYQGNLVAASAWYELGQYDWTKDNPPIKTSGGIPELAFREARAIHQLPAAICADRVGNTQRAKELYTWAAANFILPDEELQGWARTHQLQMIWELLPMRAYALACLEDWTEAKQAAEVAQFWVKKDRGAEHSREQIQLLPILLALSRWKLEPSIQNQQEAQKRLGLKAITARDFADRLHCYFYLFNLRARFGSDLLSNAGENT